LAKSCHSSESEFAIFVGAARPGTSYFVSFQSLTNCSARKSEQEFGIAKHIIASESKEARSADQAIRLAKSFAAMESQCAAIAFA
jgi:hypothetical protein